MGWTRSKPRPAATSERPEVEMLTAAGRRIRYDVRLGDPRQPPLLLCCGIGAGFEVLQPVVDVLDRTVIRFDVPGVGVEAIVPVATDPPVTPFTCAVISRFTLPTAYP